ncbi:MAG: hypothetical protein ACI4OS_03265 [Akkermansia sp.]
MRWLSVISFVFAAVLLFCGVADAVLSVAGAMKVYMPLEGVLRALSSGLLTMAAGVMVTLLAGLLQLRLDAAEQPEPEAEPAPHRRPQTETSERPVYFPVREDTRPSAEVPCDAAPEEENVPQPKTQFFKLN